MDENSNNELDSKVNKLIADLKVIRLDAKKQLAQQSVNILLTTYWQMGKRISQDPVFSEYLDGQNSPVLKMISDEIEIEYTLFTRIIKLYNLWPDEKVFKQNSNLSFSHFKKLMALSDVEQRNFYLNEAQKNNWNKQELVYRIKCDYKAATQTSPRKARDVLLRSQQSMYLYSGIVKKVVDGDTLLIDGDLGFKVHVELRLRLRGINCCEINDSDQTKNDLAVKAKEFVMNQLKSADVIVFQSFKIDLYGRYVADVYYLPGETDKELVFKNGRFLNQDLLDSGLAVLI